MNEQTAIPVVAVIILLSLNLSILLLVFYYLTRQLKQLRNCIGMVHMRVKILQEWAIGRQSVTTER